VDSVLGFLNVIFVSMVKELGLEVLSVGLQVLLSYPLEHSSFHLRDRLLQSHVLEGTNDLTHAINLSVLTISISVNSLKESLN